MYSAKYWENLPPDARDDGQEAIAPLLILGQQLALRQIEENQQVSNQIINAALPNSHIILPPRTRQAAGFLGRLGSAMAERGPVVMQNGFFTEAQNKWLADNSAHMDKKIDYEHRQRASGPNSLYYFLRFIDSLNMYNPRPANPHYFGNQNFRELARTVRSDWLTLLTTKAANTVYGEWGIPDNDPLPSSLMNIGKAADEKARQYARGATRDQLETGEWKPVVPVETGYALAPAECDRLKSLKDKLNDRSGLPLPVRTPHDRRPTIGCPVRVPLISLGHAEKALTAKQLKMLEENHTFEKQDDKFVRIYDPFKALGEFASRMLLAAI